MPEIIHKLSSNVDIVHTLAELFTNSTTVELAVREPKVFEQDKWLSLGSISLFPPSQIVDYGGQIESLSNNSMVVALINGAFTWRLPDENDLQNDLKDCYGSASDATEFASDACKIVVEAIQDCCRRLLLTYPTFDPSTLSNWPLKRPITIVPDTSAVLQGALDFVSNFLCPMARVKIPAVVSLEILNMADRFLSLWRNLNNTKNTNKNTRLGCLKEHTRSQGSQRTLLRIELISDTEIERPVQGADPIRMIYQQDNESTFKNLNLTTVNRSLADRLVFESAKEHQSRLAAAHPICVLTSDQGLARMALSEGMEPIFFEARKTSSPIGRTLIGALYHPFESTLSSVPLTSVLWELATCFGCLRIRSIDNNNFIEVTAIGESLSWYPYQSKDDLLWCYWDISKAAEQVISSTEDIAIDQPIEDLHTMQIASEPIDLELPNADIDGNFNETLRVDDVEAPSIPSQHSTGVSTSRPPAYVFSPSKLLSLIHTLSADGKLEFSIAYEALGIKAESFRDYRNFLASGGFIIINNHEEIVKTSKLDKIAKAINNIDIASMATCFMDIPLFDAFIKFVIEEGLNPNWRSRCWIKRSGALRGLESLAEICGFLLEVPGEGVVFTDSDPTVKQFTEQAISAFNELASDDGYVLVGRWLECLAFQYKVHPVRAKKLLHIAIDNGEINCLLEGSTPDTRFENHTLDVLTTNEGNWSIRRYHLYRGDFLFPNRAAIRIHIERSTS